MSVTLDEVVSAARLRVASLVAELSGYLVLAAADHFIDSPRQVTSAEVLLQEDGSIIVIGGEACDEAHAEGCLRALLAECLAVSRSGAPAIHRAASASTRVGVSRFVIELEAALIPVNRAASRRALARLHREVSRAKGARLLDEAADVASTGIAPAGMAMGRGGHCAVGRVVVAEGGPQSDVAVDLAAREEERPPSDEPDLSDEATRQLPKRSTARREDGGETVRCDLPPPQEQTQRIDVASLHSPDPPHVTDAEEPVTPLVESRSASGGAVQRFHRSNASGVPVGGVAGHPTRQGGQHGLRGSPSVPAVPSTHEAALPTASFDSERPGAVLPPSTEPSSNSSASRPVRSAPRVFAPRQSDVGQLVDDFATSDVRSDKELCEQLRELAGIDGAPDLADAKGRG